MTYYWPQYTAITHPANHDIMLFTFSKCTGHARTCIGWALVKDKQVAQKMTKFMEVSSIGVSEKSQIRAAKILGVVAQYFGTVVEENFFEYAHRLMAERWEKLQEVIEKSEIFTLPKYPEELCNCSGKYTKSYPVFAWVKSKEGTGSEALLKAYKIQGRSVLVPTTPNSACSAEEKCSTSSWRGYHQCYGNNAYKVSMIGSV